MDNPGELIAAVLVLGTLTEWIAERAFGWWVQGKWMVLTASLIGIALCLVFGVNAISALGLDSALGDPWTGRVLTGLIVGAGGDAIHLFFKKRTL